MAILTGPEILRQRELGNIVIEPFEPAHVGPNSYDVRLGSKVLHYLTGLKTTPDYQSDDGNSAVVIREYQHPQGYEQVLDMGKECPVVEEQIPAGGMLLMPGILYLGHTLERTETRGFVPYVDGRSSVGRLGMFIHVTAGRGDDNFLGQFTLEIVVTHPTRVYASVRVGQLTYHTIEGERLPYRGRYQHSKGPQPSGLWKDFRDGALSIK